MKAKRVAVIGGGLGGLSAALYLRSYGYDVTVFEKNGRPGGKLTALREGGMTYDLGPTVLTMPFVLQQLFADCGASLDEYLTLSRVDPICRYHWSDGTRFNAYSSPERLQEELDQQFPNDQLAFRRFLKDAEELYHATSDVFLFRPFDGLREFFRLRNARLLPMLTRLGFLSTMDRSASKRFQASKLVQVVNRFATYNGSSPYHAPATLNVIPFVEFGFGAWYPRGGMGEIAAGVERLARERGVEIHTGVTVQRLMGNRNGVHGVVLDGEKLPFDAVVSNVDALWTYRNLLQPLGIDVPQRMAAAQRSCSGFLMLAAVKGEHKGLAHHNVLFSDDYPSEFSDIFSARRLPREMTVYVSISARSDPALTMPGYENWYILVNAPSGGIEHGDGAAGEAYADKVLERLARFGVEPQIEWRRIVGPADFEAAYNSIGGALYGSSSNSVLSAFLRPTNRVKKVANIYLAGGSTHPGGGIPLVILSGRIAAQEVHHDLGSR